MNILDLFDEEEAKAPKHHERILVVDDEEDVREGLATLLSMEGYDVTTAENGTVALERAKSQKFELALTDLRMPGISGVETLMGLKKLHPDLQVIVVTGYAADTTVVHCMREGAYDFVIKPFDLDHLLGRIEKAIHAGKGSSQQPA